ncbi:MAG TPA: type II secretion system protein [Chromatiales bacterium]|nr:type II secretion system protein [Chromatiales bacterium]
MMMSKEQRGATLIELVISIVIIGIAVVGVLMVFTRAGGASADPMIREQAVSIAEAYMEEAFLHPLGAPADLSCEPGESRATYDDIGDYSCINDTSGARDQNGALINGLAGYNVAMSVAAVTLGGGPAKRIQVVVTHDGVGGLRIPLTAYRFN